MGIVYFAFIPTPTDSYGFFICLPRKCIPARNRQKHEVPMFDVAMLVLGIGAFALFLGYVTVCEIL